jgi:hypothetical protein
MMPVIFYVFLTFSVLPAVLGWVVSGTRPKLIARKDWESPAYSWLYQFPLPIPPVKTPVM